MAKTALAKNESATDLDELDAAPAIVDNEDTIVLLPWDGALARQCERQIGGLKKARKVKALRLSSLQRKSIVYGFVPDRDGESVSISEPVKCQVHWRENVGIEGLDGVHPSSFIGELARAVLPLRVERQQFTDTEPGIVRLSLC